MRSWSMRCNARLQRSRLLGEHPEPQSIACEARVAAHHEFMVEVVDVRVARSAMPHKLDRRLAGAISRLQH